MNVRSALLLSSLAIAFVPVSAGAKEKEKSGKKEKERERDSKKKKDKDKKEREPERPKTPPSLQLQSLDLENARAVAIVGGASKAPDSRLFSFHDDRERHFIALNAECETIKVPRAPQPEGAAAADEGADRGEKTDKGDKGAAEEERLRCELELPRGYARRGNWVQFTVRVAGREVAADPEAVKAAFASARRALPPEPAQKSRPRMPIRHGSDPAAGPAEDPGMQPPPSDGSGEDEAGEPTGD